MTTLKYTDATVASIKQAVRNRIGSQKHIAKLHGCSQCFVSYIATNKGIKARYIPPHSPVLMPNVWRIKELAELALAFRYS